MAYRTTTMGWLAPFFQTHVYTLSLGTPYRGASPYETPPPAPLLWGGTDPDGFVALEAGLGGVAGGSSWEIIAFQHEGLGGGGTPCGNRTQELEICVRSAELM